MKLLCDVLRLVFDITMPILRGNLQNSLVQIRVVMILHSLLDVLLLAGG